MPLHMQADHALGRLARCSPKKIAVVRLFLHRGVLYGAKLLSIAFSTT